MTREELKVVLELHKKWLNNEDDGARANLWGTDLRGIDLRGVDLRLACLSEADMRGVDLRGTDLSGADLWKAKLWKTRLQRAKLSEVMNFPFIPYACPEKGEFVAFKKCGKYIIELLIPADAKRCSGTTRQCRASYAKVLSITTLAGKPVNIDGVINTGYSPNIVYMVGERVYPDEFDDNRWNECSHGISFFINRQEAVEY